MYHVLFYFWGSIDVSFPFAWNVFALFFHLKCLSICAEELTQHTWLFSFKQTCLWGWPLAGVWELGVWQGSHHSQNWQEWLTVPIPQTIWFMLNTCFPSGSLKWWYIAGRGCLCDQPPIKILGASLGRNITHTLLYFCCWEKNMLCVTPHGRERAWGHLHVDSSRPHLCLFPYDPAVYPYYTTVENLSHEYNYMLSPVSPSSESSNVGWSWGPKHIPPMFKDLNLYQNSINSTTNNNSKHLYST